MKIISCHNWFNKNQSKSKDDPAREIEAKSRLPNLPSIRNRSKWVGMSRMSSQKIPWFKLAQIWCSNYSAIESTTRSKNSKCLHISILSKESLNIETITAAVLAILVSYPTILSSRCSMKSTKLLEKNDTLRLSTSHLNSVSKRTNKAELTGRCLSGSTIIEEYLLCRVLLLWNSWYRIKGLWSGDSRSVIAVIYHRLPAARWKILNNLISSERYLSFTGPSKHILLMTVVDLLKILTSSCQSSTTPNKMELKSTHQTLKRWLSETGEPRQEAYNRCTETKLKCRANYKTTKNWPSESFLL